MALNPALFSLCNDLSNPNCLFGYIFPGGVVKGVDGQLAKNALMYYVLLTKTWVLLEAPFGQVPVSYAYGRDVDLSTPDKSTTFPWFSGAASVKTEGQTVQGMSCGGSFKPSWF
eukprot:GHVS01032138.1.p2 GENE.GHVS01032138.1~~GHVS01032138.1.p2  ORF type:complete len:114 (+),score=10.59 GHVS01032138.1:838-1179(+)